ncbi:MAG TPA: MFS transporter, partial [Solirubrobacteraceae bacterium]|nr:MFS transporter [Solirubrobacteraceae bacterium]
TESRRPDRSVTARATLFLACAVTAVHYTGAYMRVPVLPLYASAQGATPAGVGAIVAAQMAVAALTAVPFGLASDRWGRGRLLFAGTLVSAVTSFGLAAVTALWALAAVYAAAGLGVAAFTPAMMSLVGDVAAPGAAARAYGWYTTALYAGFGLGPVLGGLAAEYWGERAALGASGLVVAVAVGLAAPLLAPAAPRPRAGGAAMRAVARDRTVLAGWLLTVAGIGAWGAVLTFLPLLAHDRGLGPAAIGLVLGVQALVNTVVRLPAGWLLDRWPARRPWAVGGVFATGALTAAVPLAHRPGAFLLLAAALGVVLGVAFVAVGAMLAEASTPATRGTVMGGYSTALYVGIALAAFGLGPVMAAWGYGAGFALAGAGALALTLVAGALGRGRA